MVCPAAQNMPCGFFVPGRNRFLPFRDRNWARTGPCKDCKVFDRCLGNGMHNWHGDSDAPLSCHYAKTREP